MNTHEIDQPDGRGEPRPALIRPMEERDRPVVEALLHALNVAGEAFTHDRNLADDAGRTSLVESEAWVAREGGTILVAEADGIVVGTMILAHVSLDFNVRPSLRARSYVMELAVASTHRRRGIGSLLVAAAERHARDQGHCALLLNAAAGHAPAIALYREAGFETYSLEMIRRLAPA
jgi:ribosomal protein S18 acetylase RimI-like enzyme